MRHRWLLVVLGLAMAGAFWLAEVPQNPPGFFVDESSIAYNAYTISQHGVDEHGERFPLYFAAFGEYKNPVYIYLLAALFKVTGPSQLVARSLSALLGFSAVLLLGALAGSVTRKFAVGAIVALSACLTPWLFEVSRLVFEVAFMPLALTLFLWAVWLPLRRDRWSWLDGFRIGATLALITYTSPAGRALGPLFALGLLLCAPPNRWRFLRRAWLIYALALLPLIPFSEMHPGALSVRFGHVSYVRPESGWLEIAANFIVHYLRSFNPWDWLIRGDPEPRHHVQTMGSLLAATAALAWLGVIRIFARGEWRNPFWRIVLFGLLIAPIPSALTIDRFHTLRLIAMPVFLILLTAPAIAWLLERSTRRIALAVLVLATVIQGTIFRWQFHSAAPNRWHNFDTFYPEVFNAAVAQNQFPIYLIDAHGAPGYVHAYWYGLFRGLTPEAFVRLPSESHPPPGAVTITCELPCANCRMLLERASFRAYIAE